MKYNTKDFFDGKYFSAVRQCGKSIITRKVFEKAGEALENGDEEFEVNVGFVENENGWYTIGVEE